MVEEREKETKRRRSLFDKRVENKPSKNWKLFFDFRNKRRNFSVGRQNGFVFLARKRREGLLWIFRLRLRWLIDFSIQVAYFDSQKCDVENGLERLKDSQRVCDRVKANDRSSQYDKALSSLSSLVYLRTLLGKFRWAIGTLFGSLAYLPDFSIFLTFIS